GRLRHAASINGSGGHGGHLRADRRPAARGHRSGGQPRAVRRQGVRGTPDRLSLADAGGAAAVAGASTAYHAAGRRCAMGRVRTCHGALPRRRHRQHPQPLRRARLVGRRQPLRQLGPALRRARAAAGSRRVVTAVGAPGHGGGARLRARADLGARRVVHVHPSRHGDRHRLRGHARRPDAGHARCGGGRPPGRPAGPSADV
ncbi:MAG: hypothetical protein AVDCRST_MAG21-67, partial [uncultured Nocardioidaceae bacterium]